MLLFIDCLLLLPLFLGFSAGSLFCFAVLCVLSSFAIISLGKRELVALLLFCPECHAAVIVLLLFLAVPWVYDSDISWSYSLTFSFNN